MSNRAAEEPFQLYHAAVDEAVLGLLWLGLHDERRVWKSFDWSAMERLHAEGLISDPVGKAKSVALTDEGLARAEQIFRTRFCRPPDA